MISWPACSPWQPKKSPGDSAASGGEEDEQEQEGGADL